MLKGAAATGTWTPTGVQHLVMGSAQTLVPVFVTFGFLSVSWLIVTIGMIRQEQT